MTEPIKVFIADDHPIIREGLATVVNQEDDLRVIGTAADGRQAVDQVVQLVPDVVLMDLQMPQMDGVQAILAIKEAQPQIGIIILTTFDTDDYICSGIEAGARAYLLKDQPPRMCWKRSGRSTMASR